MSKILEKKSAGETPKIFWKRFAGSVIDLKNKWWHDPFRKSEIMIVALQMCFAVALLFLAYGFFSNLYDSILRTVIGEIIQSINTGSFTSSENLVDTLQIVKANNFVVFATLLVILTAISIFFVAKLSLKPAKEALAVHKRFISDVAHELRTPLAVIKTNNEVVLMDDDVDPKTRDFLKSNIEELDRMSEIINNVLSFNNLLRPKKIKFEKVNLGIVIDSVMEKLAPLAKKKNLDVVVKKISPHMVWGNQVALGQVITNLLKNAINYTPPGGRVTIRLGPDFYGNTLIHIEDTGVGITKKDLMHVFEPFYRAEHSRNRSTGSSGLGLTIASEIVKMHSGRLSLRSAEDRGTVAVVTLPYNESIKEEEKIDLSGLNEISINFLGDK